MLLSEADVIYQTMRIQKST